MRIGRTDNLLGMKHSELRPIIIYKHYDLGFTLTNFTARDRLFTKKMLTLDFSENFTAYDLRIGKN